MDNTVSPSPVINVTYHCTLTVMKDQIPVFLAEDGRQYLTLDALCKLFGLNIATQVAQIQKHLVLVSGLRTASDTKAPLLEAGHTALWLATVKPEEVPHIRDREELIRFQQESLLVLGEAFYAGRLSEWPFLAPLLKEPLPMATAYREALALMNRVRNGLLEQARQHRLIWNGLPDTNTTTD